MTVYLNLIDGDWTEADAYDADGNELEEPTRPSPDAVGNYDGPIPRVGEFVYTGRRWWRVERVLYSALLSPEGVRMRSLGAESVDCWVDVTLKLVEADNLHDVPVGEER